MYRDKYHLYYSRFMLSDRRHDLNAEFLVSYAVFADVLQLVWSLGFHNLIPLFWNPGSAYVQGYRADGEIEAEENERSEGGVTLMQSWRERETGSVWGRSSDWFISNWVRRGRATAARWMSDRVVASTGMSRADTASVPSVPLLAANEARSADTSSVMPSDRSRWEVKIQDWNRI